MLDVPAYAPVPRSALGPKPEERGYHVSRVERNLYRISDGNSQAAFLTTAEAVVLFDAPPALGGAIRRAVEEVAAANGVGDTITHLVYSHHHADRIGASARFGDGVIRIGHEETRRLLLRADDPARPAPDVSFDERHSLEVGGERVELAWHGASHSADNIFIHLPDHEALMLVDVVDPGWAPDYRGGLVADVQGCLLATKIALDYSWHHFIGGAATRLGTRDDLALHLRFLDDLEVEVRTALDTVDPAPFLRAYGENRPVAEKEYLEAVAAQAAAAMVGKYEGSLAGIDAFAPGTALALAQSLRLDLGYGLEVRR